MSSAAVQATERWLEEFVIGLDLCPFAAAPFRAGRVRVVESEAATPEELFAELIEEVARLERGAASTTLLVIPTLMADFEELLDVVAFAEEELIAPDFVQLVAFHPDYQFADAPADDPANATNRSPIPLIHLLRRDEVAAAVASHPDIHSIPERNVRMLRERAKVL